ncbi:MAG: ferredoxin [Rhodospirillales bacterium]
MAAISEALAGTGLMVRGGFHPAPEDGVPGDPKTLALVGNAGPEMWQAFAAATTPEARADGADPLDDWASRVLDAAAQALGAGALYPFQGPPYLPFQRWALRTGVVHVSPTGPLIDAEYGLWHAYRGALAFAEHIALPPSPDAPSPCESCLDKPCLSACPVHAFGPPEGGVAAYDVPRCIAHVTSAEGGDCRSGGCLARRACPVGRDYLYGPEQAAFHMARFLKAQGAVECAGKDAGKGG